MRRMFDKYGSQLAAQRTESPGAVCLMFDGRKDQALSVDRNNPTGAVRKIMKEEHIVIVEEPGSVYRGHFTPESGKATAIAHELYIQILKWKSENTITVIGADGTAVNTAVFIMEPFAF